jgi:hypothetical protein
VFGLFRKKAPAYPSESQWSVGRGERDGKPIFVRRNTSAASLARHPEYRFRVGVAVPLKAPKPDGLPTDQEMNELNAIEDHLCECLEQRQESLHVLAITTGGMREFVFYTRSPARVGPNLAELRSKVTTHELQSYVAEDPKWSVYAQFA